MSLSGLHRVILDSAVGESQTQDLLIASSVLNQYNATAEL